MRTLDVSIPYCSTKSVPYCSISEPDAETHGAVFDQPRDSAMNAHGGKRPGAGRPKGAASRANEQVRQEAAATDELPFNPPRRAARHPQIARGALRAAAEPNRDHRATIAMANVKRTFWSKWSRTRDHGPVLNGTDRHVRPIFAIQINTCQDRTKRVETANNKFRVRCLQALSAHSVAAKRSIWFGRLRASPFVRRNVEMDVGS